MCFTEVNKKLSVGRKSKIQKFLDEDNKKEIEYIRMMFYSKMSHQEKTEILAEHYGVTTRTIRNWFTKLSLTTSDYSLPPELRRARDKEIPKDADMVFVAYAQSKTMPNFKMLNSMLCYKKFVKEKFGLKAAIVLIPGRYRNPTSPIETSKNKEHIWWHKDLLEYIYYNKLQFGDAFIATDTRVRPTAKMPLTGFESMVGDHHLTLGHPRIHLKTMPRYKGGPLRIMNTTGAVTIRNYSDSKAGDIGYIHHSYGFTIIEKTKENPNVCHPPRAIKVNSGGDFVDLGYHVTPDKVTKIKSSEAFTWGDMHLRYLDPQKFEATCRLLDILNPKMNIMHDLGDWSTVNYHEKEDLYIRRKKIRDNAYLVDEEEEEIKTFLRNFIKRYPQRRVKKPIKVVHSNHDDFLDKWVNKFNWKDDLHNPEAYFRYAKIQQTQDLEEYGNIFGYLISKEFPDTVEYIPNTGSLRVKGYQVGKHGHEGINGARGSITSFKKMNTKQICGHGHSPVIIDGLTMVGVSCFLWLYYNSGGASSWAHADSVVYENGKNQLIIYGDDYKISRLIDV